MHWNFKASIIFVIFYIMFATAQQQYYNYQQNNDLSKVPVTDDVYVKQPRPWVPPDQKMEYSSFLKHLYRFDTTKVVDDYLTRRQRRDLEDTSEVKRRQKRIIIFRPKFVYRQQELQKKKLKDAKKNQQIN